MSLPGKSWLAFPFAYVSRTLGAVLLGGIWDVEKGGRLSQDCYRSRNVNPINKIQEIEINMVTTNSTKATAAKAAAQTLTAETELAALESVNQPVAAAGRPISNGRGAAARPQRFADTDSQRAYYSALDQGLNDLIAGLVEQYGQQELTVIDDIGDRMAEKQFTIKCKIVKAVAAGKAGTGEQLSDAFRTAFADVMKRVCGAMFPSLDPDVLLKMKGLPGINGSRFSRMMVQQLANRFAEEYGGSELASEGYNLLEEAREARQPQ